MADGATAGEHAESAARQFEKMGIRPKRPIVEEGPEFPQPVSYIWNWWNDLSLGLAVSGMAAPVVTWEGLLAWSLQMKVDLEPWEAIALIRISHKRAIVLSEDPKKAPHGGQNPDRPDRKGY